MTYAIIETGGKQYRVSPGDILKIEKIEGKPGDVVELDGVLMVSDDQGVKVGNPTIPGARVEASIKAHGKGKKVTVFKFKNKGTIKDSRATVNPTRDRNLIREIMIEISVLMGKKDPIH